MTDAGLKAKGLHYALPLRAMWFDPFPGKQFLYYVMSYLVRHGAGDEILERLRCYLWIVANAGMTATPILTRS